MRINRFHAPTRLRLEALEARDVPVNPSVLDPNLAVRTAVGGLNQPTGIAFLGANDFLVTEKATGQVKRVTNGAVAGTVLDLAVNSGSERGLLGIELHPNFRQERLRLPVLDREHHRGRHGGARARPRSSATGWTGSSGTGPA